MGNPSETAAHTHRQALVVFYGLPGTGKTALASAFASVCGGVYLGTDYVRKRVFSRPTYVPAEKALVYSALFLLAEHLARVGHTPVLDGTFSQSENRYAALRLGSELGIPVLLFLCCCPAELSLGRIRERKDPLSDADAMVYARLKDEWEETPGPHLLLHTDENLPRNLEMALAHARMTLPSVPLTPPNVNLMDHPDILIGALQRLRTFFEEMDVPWYIQSSLATHLHGVRDRVVTDIDVRADCPMEPLFEHARRNLDPAAVLRGPVTYGKGEFRNSCIILDLPELGTHIDVTTVIHTYRSDAQVLFRVPFDRNHALMTVHWSSKEVFPVCSLEYLIIYKLVNQRGADERKNDLWEVASLLASLARH